MLKSFRLSQYRIILKAKEPILMPQYSGSTLRGGFGHAFKKIVCTKGLIECKYCMLKSVCPYPYVFETSPTDMTTQLRSYSDVPRPFIIDPLETHGSYKPDETIEFRLTLIGHGIDYLPYFLVSFNELGEIGIGKGRGRFQLSEVIADSGLDKNISVYSYETVMMNNLNTILSFSDVQQESDKWSKDQITLHFQTPTRILNEGQLSEELPFHIFIQRLIGRISALSYFHCGESLEMDFKEFVSQAAQIETTESSLYWHDWTRYSQRQDRQMKLGGILGKITYTGDLEQFLQFITLGQYIHIGKNVTFGLGKYRVVV
jgi:hypothetical protein